MPCSLASDILLSPGRYADLKALAPYHYRPGRATGIVRIFRATHQDRESPDSPPFPSRLAGVLVESLPLLASAARNAATGNRYALPDALLAAALLNDEVRCISRVIVHPVYRGMGLAVRLVRHALQHAETTYVESFAAMGRIHPFFQLAGMTPRDHPATEADARITAALAHAGLKPLDLCDRRRCLFTLAGTHGDFLLHELRRYCHFGHASSTPEELLARTRRRLLSQPIYYLWQRPTEHG